jgi:hypothetical protein
MPIFLLPIVVGGYYYLKSRNELPDVNTEDHDASSSSSSCSSDTPVRAGLEEECPSIEVSLMSDWETQQSGSCEPSWQDPPDNDDDLAIRGVQSRVLSRKESTDTVQSEVCEEVDLPKQPPIDNSDQDIIRMLSSSCVDCDHGFLFEMVDCGNSSDCDTGTITTFRRNVSVEC